MQLILNQAEIELAIREFVDKRVAISEDVNIQIDLKATRGDAGFTANIDLVDSAPNGTSAAEVRPLSIVEKARAARVTTTPKPAAAPATQEAAQETVEGTPVDPATEVAVEASEPSTLTEEVAAAEAETKQDDAPVPEKPRSLFANLQKPRNTN